MFFRDTCRREALSRSVSGWVINRSDGSVEVALEGEPAAVEEMLAWCRHGPERANVATVEISEENPRGDSGFEVR